MDCVYVTCVCLVSGASEYASMYYYCERAMRCWHVVDTDHSFCRENQRPYSVSKRLEEQGTMKKVKRTHFSDLYYNTNMQDMYQMKHTAYEFCKHQTFVVVQRLYDVSWQPSLFLMIMQVIMKNMRRILSMKLNSM